MTDLISEFKAESLVLVKQMISLLEKRESGNGQAQDLENFAQFADRIMGASQQISTTNLPDTPVLLLISKVAELCKILGYKTAQVPTAQPLHGLAVGVLLDAASEMDRLVSGLSGGAAQRTSQVSTTLVERLKWLNQQFSKEIQGGVPISQVDVVLEKLRSKG